MRRFDVVVAMTSPPLISLLAALYVKLRGGRLVFWVMDLNPDEAIAAGWLREGTVVTRLLHGALRYSLVKAGRIVVLDRFMRERILAKGIAADKIDVIPPWSHDSSIRYAYAGREAFRSQHGLNGKLVVMYSGNHSPCHPLDTLLEAARRLSHHPEIAFCFVGGGSEFTKVQQYAKQHALTNIICLPYQPLGRLSDSLSAADLHTVVLGESFVGIVHPCKVYNIISLGIPLLYIGPKESHVTDLLPEDAQGYWAHIASHGDPEQVVANIENAARMRVSRVDASNIAAHFSEQSLIAKMRAAIDGSQAGEGRRAPAAAQLTMKAR